MFNPFDKSGVGVVAGPYTEEQLAQHSRAMILWVGTIAVVAWYVLLRKKS